MRARSRRRWDAPLSRSCITLPRWTRSHEESQLFRFLFQTNAFGGQDLTALVAAPEVRELVGVVAQEAGVDVARARQVFLAIFVAAHGYASLLANNALEYDETQVTDVLLAAYAGALQMEGR